MKKKILIVGGSWWSFRSSKLRRHSEEDEIIMFERGPHVSFSNCSLPYYLSGVVEEAEDLVLMEPELFLKQYNIDARVNSEVISIDRINKTVRIKRTDNEEEYTDNYDKLVLSPGASPIVPKLEGMDRLTLLQ